MNRMMKAVVALVLAASPLAHAQRVTAPVRDKEAATFNEIERGFHASVTGGFLLFLNAPATTGPRPVTAGQVARVDLGFDIGEWVSLSLFVMATANRAGSDYLGYSRPAGCEVAGTCIAASGDFFGVIPGVTGKVNFLGFRDVNEVKRLWLYARVGGGYGFFSPRGLLPSDVILFAGPGVEYFTQLRHFTVGLEVTAQMMLSSATIGFAVTPNLRYAF